MDVALLVFLILLNALFAMSEMALTASRKARLAVMVETGDAGAQAAMTLHDNPTRWLSTVQIGITSISVLNGIVGDAAFSAPFAKWLQETLSIHDRAAEIAATAMVVVTITFLTIIFGELVPKRLGQMYPENVARLVAQPMEWLSLAMRKRQAESPLHRHGPGPGLPGPYCAAIAMARWLGGGGGGA